MNSTSEDRYSEQYRRAIDELRSHNQQIIKHLKEMQQSYIAFAQQPSASTKLPSTQAVQEYVDKLVDSYENACNKLLNTPIPPFLIYREVLNKIIERTQQNYTQIKELTRDYENIKDRQQRIVERVSQTVPSKTTKSPSQTAPSKQATQGTVAQCAEGPAQAGVDPSYQLRAKELMDYLNMRDVDRFIETIADWGVAHAFIQKYGTSEAVPFLCNSLSKSGSDADKMELIAEALVSFISIGPSLPPADIETIHQTAASVIQSPCVSEGKTPALIDLYGLTKPE